MAVSTMRNEDLIDYANDDAGEIVKCSVPLCGQPMIGLDVTADGALLPLCEGHWAAQYLKFREVKSRCVSVRI
jgi:hypothetical protein